MNQAADPPETVFNDNGAGCNGLHSSSNHSSKSATTSSSQRSSSKTNSRHKKKKFDKNRRADQHITFADYDMVFEIPHVNDLPASVIRDVYLSSDELRAIRRDCIGTVQQMNEGGDNMPEGSFLRGLDQHTLKYKERKTGIDKRVYETVFRIQEFQRNTGVDASHIMAKHCANNSEPSVAAAHIAAISDLFSSFKGTWSERSIPAPEACSAKPTQGTYQ